jgi:hypothetical protein
MGRSLLAVIAGYAVMAAAIMILFALWFRDPTTVPSQGFMLFSLGYGFIFAVLGGYLTALLARRAEMKHTLALAGFSALLGGASMITFAGQEPLWY